MKTMKLLRRVLYHSLFLGLIISYQNCTQVNFETLPNSDSALKFGNGSAYGGKPSIDLYRFSPEFTCEQKEAPVSTIQITNNQISVTENKKLQCGAVKFSLESNQIDTSIYQKELVGYQEGIFESKDSVPESIPANLVEVWCKDTNDEQGIETISHFDRFNKTAVNRIYYSAKGPDGTVAAKQIMDFPVSRTAAQNTVTLKDGKDFQLIVHRDQPSPQLGLFLAHLNAVIEGQNISRETHCRLGGSLDPRIWPAQQIVDFNVSLFKVSPDVNHFAYSSKTATGIGNLYAANILGTEQLLVSPQMLSTGISADTSGSTNFMFTRDSSSLIYSGDVHKANMIELFKVNVDGTANTQLNQPLVDPRHGVLSNFKLSGDGGSVIYADGSISISSGSGVEKSLFSVPIGGGLPKVLNNPFSWWNGNIGAYRFGISNSQNKVIYFCCGYYSEFYISNIDGTDIKKFPLILPSGDKLISSGSNVFIPDEGNYVFIWTFTYSKSSHVTSFALALDGSGLVEFPPGYYLHGNPVEHFALLKSENPAAQPDLQLLNMKIGSLRVLPHLDQQSVFFTQDKTALVGQQILSDENIKAVSVSIESALVTDLCSGIFGRKMLIDEIEENRFIILTFDERTQILNSYLKSPNSACQKVNSAVISSPTIKSIRSLSFSSDKTKILVTMAGSTRDQLFYIPLNGQPGFLVNTPVFDSARILQSYFLNDSRTILYVGDQIRPGENNVFLWKVP